MAPAATARAIGADVRQRLTDLGMSEQKAMSLAHDTEIIAGSLLTSDVEPYLALAAARGWSLAPFAANLMSHLRENCYADVQASEWGGSFSQQFRYAWEHPARRAVEIDAVFADSVESGIGMIVQSGAPDWPGSSLLAQNSVFERAAIRPTKASVASMAEKQNCAWVQFQVRFTSGYESRLRIISYFDDEISSWVPFAVAIEGLSGHYAYLLL